MFLINGLENSNRKVYIQHLQIFKYKKMVKVPKIKKKLSAYIMGEEGRISKQALLAMGAFLGSGVLASILLSSDVQAWVDHTNALSVSYNEGNGVASATHSHH